MEGGPYVTIHGQNVTHNPLSAPAMSIDRLFPALLECFGIILCGYLAGRSEVISVGQARSLGSFVSCFALPALLFKNMVQLRFGNVVWAFLWSVLIAKLCVFVLVCVLTLLVASPDGRFGKAGLFAIFATQSNDFALGYPIVDALYRSSHPEYTQYLYLVAPVSLMLLNPVGFALCELQRWRQSPDLNHSKLHIVSTVLLRVAKNPIVFMVLIGIVSHFLFGGRVPLLLEEFVDGLADSFGGAALFYLGLTMVGQMGRVTRSTGVTLILLLTAKLLVMPLMCKDMLDLLDAPGNSSSANRTGLSDYAFLYGVFPTAPSVAIYASQYNMQLEVVTSGMVISTLLSAPIMYLSAWLLSIPWMKATHLISELQEVSFNISIISIISLVWTVAVMVLGKKFKRLPHMFTTNLFLAQLLVCVSMSLWKSVVQYDNVLGQILTFTLLYGALYSTYIWTGLLALSLALLKKNEQLKVPPVIFILFGWGLPFLIVGLLLAAGERMSDTADAAFFYGKAQIISSAVVLSCSILLSGVSLMGLSQGSQEEQNYQILEQSSMSGTTEDVRIPARPEDHDSAQITPSHSSQNDPTPDTRADRLNDTSAPPTDAALSEASMCSRVQEERQVTRHVLLCLLLAVGLLANLSSCLWWLLNSDPGRLYLELQFFCAVANYGQGLISFGMFGLDEHLIILPFKKRLAALLGGAKETSSAPPSAPEEIRLTCTQLVRYHKNQCVQDIVHKTRSAVGRFPASELVDYVRRVGVVRDRGSEQVTCRIGFRDDGKRDVTTCTGRRLTGMFVLTSFCMKSRR
ncbi:integral membrane protein GPR155 isoform X1 [Clarias gariepinus]|uniref:integral membrane protein GPR155 isoform X1 n=1 Tax=Clarias gariepinus TaxID=13013 RepID=UPI00234E2A2B|nr:integral membrane protein GPR155 isoform X1 [Clarias gariepinus]XP_053355452.1 integral membrane protein GPR155 isoform X1 [Clarias gariepinus]